MNKNIHRNLPFHSIAIILIILSLLAGCNVGNSSPTQSPSESAASATLTEPAAAITETPLPTPRNTLIIVTSIQDSGPGSLRQALLDAQPSDTIRFDPAVFPSANPTTISLETELPSLDQGGLVLDASDAGVILDGSRLTDGWHAGLRINSPDNVIRGLQIIHFTGPAINLGSQATGNIIGGDRKTGTAPNGQGNIFSLNGVGIAVNGASGNRFIGNLIGVDHTGEQLALNTDGALFFDEGAHDNVFGPDNVIAFPEDRTGFDIRCPACTANYFTQGNILNDNLYAALIYNKIDPTTYPQPPVFLEYDLVAGTVSGVTCPDCVVEIYAFRKEKGVFYQGRTQADAGGYFFLALNHPVEGDAITALTITPTGATSCFVNPTSASVRRIKRGEDGNTWLQANNPAGIQLFQSLPSKDLDQNWIGDTSSAVQPFNTPYAVYEGDMYLANLFGYKLVRISFGDFSRNTFMESGQYAPTQFGEFEDTVIDSLNKYNIAILYNLTYFVPELTFEKGYHRFQNEEEIQAYLDYVRMVVSHFRGRIQYYETWNEPDHDNSGQQSILVQDYIKVLRRVIPVIREADPQAKVIIGAGSYLLYDFPRVYLEALLQSDVIALADGIAIHPMYGSSPAYPHVKDYYENYDQMIRAYQEKAVQQGFNGVFFAEELTWRTEKTYNPDEPETYSPLVAAKYYLRGMVINRGLNVVVGVGGVAIDRDRSIAQAVKNLNTILSGAEPISAEIILSDEPAPIRRYAFKRSDGAIMLAIWRDDAAVDEDAGLFLNIEWKGIQGSQMIGVDVLNSYQQPLQFSTTENGLLLEDIVIPDYPLFIVVKE